MIKAWYLLGVVIAVLAVLVSACPVQAADLVDHFEDGTILIDTYSQFYSGQSFTASENYKLEQVSIEGERLSSSTATVTVRVKTGSMTGTVIATGTFNSSAWPNGSKGWGTATMSPQPDLTSGTMYYIEVYTSATGNHYVIWDTTSPTYTGGTAYQSSNYGSSYTQYSGSDMNFRTYGTIAPMIPVEPSDFTAVRVGTATVNLTWSIEPPSDSTEIWVSKDGYPWDTGTGYMVYSGAAENTTVDGLPEFVTYYFSAWGLVEDEYSDNTSDVMLEGVGMDVSIGFDSSLVVLVLAGFLLLVSIFIKNMILNLALFLAWFWVIVTVNDGYIDGIAGVVMLYAVLNFLKLRKEKNNMGV